MKCEAKLFLFLIFGYMVDLRSEFTPACARFKRRQKCVDIVTRPPTMSRSAGRSSLTPESLVSALLPHISKQTSLLPTFHTQLGLPPSALESDLSALREALLQTVEECVNNRRKEIDAWEERCEKVERRCRRLENALGRRASSLGNAKKQTVCEFIVFIIFMAVYLGADCRWQTYALRINAFATCCPLRLPRYTHCVTKNYRRMKKKSINSTYQNLNNSTI